VTPRLSERQGAEQRGADGFTQAGKLALIVPQKVVPQRAVGRVSEA